MIAVYHSFRWRFDFITVVYEEFRETADTLANRILLECVRAQVRRVAVAELAAVLAFKNEPFTSLEYYILSKVVSFCPLFASWKCV